MHIRRVFLARSTMRLVDTFTSGVIVSVTLWPPASRRVRPSARTLLVRSRVVYLREITFLHIAMKLRERRRQSIKCDHIMNVIMVILIITSSLTWWGIDTSNKKKFLAIVVALIMAIQMTPSWADYAGSCGRRAAGKAGCCKHGQGRCEGCGSQEEGRAGRSCQERSCQEGSRSAGG